MSELLSSGPVQTTGGPGNAPKADSITARLEAILGILQSCHAAAGRLESLVGGPAPPEGGKDPMPQPLGLASLTNDVRNRALVLGDRLSAVIQALGG